MLSHVLLAGTLARHACTFPNPSLFALGWAFYPGELAALLPFIRGCLALSPTRTCFTGLKARKWRLHGWRRPRHPKTSKREGIPYTGSPEGRSPEGRMVTRVLPPLYPPGSWAPERTKEFLSEKGRKIFWWHSASPLAGGPMRSALVANKGHRLALSR
jgi:hypothetical protein